MIGKTVSHYKIVEILGEGGMGIVYKAQDVKLRRFVALKFLPPHLVSRDEDKQRLIEEAKAASALDHPNVCIVHEIDETEDGQIFIVMAFYQGETLKEMIEKSPLSVDQVLDFAVQVGKGLQEAHEKGIVHRDIKSANIMVTDKGQVKIMDFGLAKLGRRTQITKTGSTVGTAAYMSPEQSRGEDVDGRSDIWSFGVVLYEMLTGKLPFRGDYEQAVVYSILHDKPETIENERSKVPTELQRLVSRCLEKEPASRYQSSESLKTELLRIQRSIGASGAEIRSEAANPIALRLFRNRSVAFAFTLIVILFALFVLFRLFTTRGEEPAGVRKMIAVLPFENLGPPEDEYFADGITEEITSRLANLNELGVISRTSAIQYKSSNKALKQIGEELDVDYILEGTVRWEQVSEGGGRVRVTPQLIRISDDTHIWSDQYDQTIQGIFDVQTEIAEQVVKQLDLNLLEPERQLLRARPTDNLDAYDYFLRGFEHMVRGFSTDESGAFERSIGMFQKAVELDTAFAAAHAWLSNIHSWQYFNGFDQTEQRLAKSKAAIDQALRISPDLPLAHDILGYYYYRGFLDYERALKEFEYVKRVRPNFSPEIVGYIERRQGKFEQSLETLEEACKLNPRDANLPYQQGLTLMTMRRYGKAEIWYDRSLSISQDFYNSRESKAWNCVLWKGDVREAGVIASPLPETPEFAISRMDLSRVGRSFREMEKQIADFPDEAYELQYSFFQKHLAYASLYHWMKKPSLMKTYADSAVIVLEREVRERHRDPRRRIALGLAYAYLGRKAEAIREGERATELYPFDKDRFGGWEYIADLARICTIAGEHEAAIDRLRYLLTIPSEISLPVLKLDPVWDGLRDHPEFQRLLAEKTP